jgi:hypothetical protein
MNKKRVSELTSKQLIALHATKVAQKTVRLVTFGRCKPFWVIHLAGRFLAAQKNSEISDTDSEPPSIKGIERKMTIIRQRLAVNTSRYKRRAQTRLLFAPP